jgi:CRP-like cAMP-binding protein
VKESFEILFRDAKRHLCAKGQILVQADEEPRGVFFIHSGYIKIYDITPDGEYQLITVSGPNEVFPLFTALDGQPRQLFYETMCQSEVSLLSQDEFRQIVMHDVEWLQLALATVMHSLQSGQQRIQNLQLHTARERIAYRLVFWLENYGSSHPNSLEIAVPFTYQDLADALCITRETANRVMRDFIKAGFIKRINHRIIIRNLQGLQAACNDVSLEISRLQHDVAHSSNLKTLHNS